MPKWQFESITPAEYENVLIKQAVWSLRLEEMWPSGPWRLISPVRRGNLLPAGSGEFLGAYACRSCRKVSPMGVYGQLWICSACRTA